MGETHRYRGYNRRKAGNKSGDTMDEIVSEQIEQAPPQKMIPQDEVNRLVGREKARAADAARREVESKYQQDMEALNALRQQQDQRNTQVPKQVDADTIYQQLTEKFNADRMKAQANEVANNYFQSMQKAKPSYEDFDEVTKDMDPTQFPQLVWLASGIPNGGDVMYDLLKNPMKLASINMLAERTPELARSELFKLSKSIQDNRQAQAEAATQNVSEPLDRLSPSKVAGSNGKMSIRDLRNQPWMRG